MALWRIWASYQDVEGRGLGETFHALLEAQSRDEALRMAVLRQRLPVGFTYEDDVPELAWHSPSHHFLLTAEQDAQTWADDAGHRWKIEFDWVEQVA